MRLSIILSLASLPFLIIATTEGQYEGWTNGSYRFHQGDGSAARGWPAMHEWLDFNTLWNMNTPAMLKACGNLYPKANVTDNQPIEMPLIKLVIEINANVTHIDPRFILAIILQESEGCVRAGTTIAPGDNTIFNPGLMQTHEGSYSCNRNGSITTPCPWEQIFGMVQDGAAGTAAGDGLAACLNEVVTVTPPTSNSTTMPYPKTETQAYYMAARLYNSGHLSPDGDLGNATASTGCYCSDVANRLMGWTNALPNLKRDCCLDTYCRINSTSTSTSKSKRASTGLRRERRLADGWFGVDDGKGGGEV